MSAADPIQLSQTRESGVNPGTTVRRSRPPHLRVSWGTQTSFSVGPHGAVHGPATDCVDPAYARHCALLLFCAPSMESPANVHIIAKHSNPLRPDIFHQLYNYSVLSHEATPKSFSGCKPRSTAIFGHVDQVAPFIVLVLYRS